MLLKTDHNTLSPPHGRRAYGKRVFFVVLLAISTLTGGCTSIPRSDTKVDIADACSIVRNRNHWYQSMKKSFRKWGIPVHVQMAIFHQESKFKAKARPPIKKTFWFLPGSRASTAFGYSQALDGTWAQYQKQTKNPGAKRDNFEDAADFVGWYGNISHRKLKISNGNANALYLAYHEGHGGYKRKTYRKKKWLIKVAKKVENNARRYRKQLARCK